MKAKLTDLTWEYHIDLSGLETPLAQCTCSRTGQMDRMLVEQLEVKRIDQAPVLDVENYPIGLLDTVEAKKLCDAGLPLENTHPYLKKQMVPRELSVRDLLNTLLDQQAALVLDRSQAEDGHEDHIVTHSCPKQEFEKGLIAVSRQNN